MSLIPWLLLGLGAFALYWAGDLERKRAASRSWPRVRGHLQVVRPRELSGNFDDELLIPLVVAEYRVGGKTFFCSEIDLSGENAVAPEVFDRKMEGLERGAPVDVFYDPARPSRSVLRPGEADGSEILETSRHGLLLLAGGLVVLAVELAAGLPFFDALRTWLP